MTMVRRLLLCMTHLVCVGVTVCHFGPHFVPHGPPPHGPPPFRPTPPPFFRHDPSFRDHMIRKHYMAKHYMSKMSRNRHVNRWMGDRYHNYVVAAEYPHARRTASLSNSYIGRHIPISRSQGGGLPGASPYESHMALKHQRAASAGSFSGAQQRRGHFRGLATAEFRTGRSGPAVTSVRASAHIRTAEAGRRPSRRYRVRNTGHSGRGGKRINPSPAALRKGETGPSSSRRRSGPSPRIAGGGVDATLSAAIRAGDTLVHTDLKVGDVAAAQSVGSPGQGPAFLDSFVGLDSRVVAGKHPPHGADVVTQFTDMRKSPGPSGASAPNHVDFLPSNQAVTGPVGGPNVLGGSGSNIAVGFEHIGAAVDPVGGVPVYPKGPVDHGVSVDSAGPIVAGSPGSAVGAKTSHFDQSIAGNQGGHVGSGANTELLTTIVEQTVHTNTLIDQQAKTAAGAVHVGAVASGVPGGAAGHVVDQTSGAFHGTGPSPGVFPHSGSAGHVIDKTAGAGTGSVGHVIDQTHGALSGAGAAGNLIDQTHDALSGAGAAGNLIDQTHGVRSGAGAAGNLIDQTHGAHSGAGSAGNLMDQTHGALSGAGSVGHTIDQTHGALAGAGSADTVIDSIVNLAAGAATKSAFGVDPMQSNTVVVAADAGHPGRGNFGPVDPSHSATGGFNTASVGHGTAAGGANDIISAHTMLDPSVKAGNMSPASNGGLVAFDLSNYVGLIDSGHAPNSQANSLSHIGNAGTKVQTLPIHNTQPSSGHQIPAGTQAQAPVKIL